MTIELKVTWNNSSSNLISNLLRSSPTSESLVVVAQHDAAAPEVAAKRTMESRVFVLQDDGDTKITFHAMIDVPGAALTGLQTALKVVQRFTCTGGAIVPSSYDIQSTDPKEAIGVAGIPGVHPLVSLPTAQQARGAAVMFIQMDFVDVTDAWLDRSRIEASTPALLPDIDQWNRSPHFECRLRVLACLNGFPRLWFASIPKACTTADTVSALVFFRPRGYPYHLAGDDFSTVFSPNHIFYKMWRFLVSPVCLRPGVSPLPPKGTLTASRSSNERVLDDGDLEGNVAAAVERTLHESGRSLVVLFPVPHDATYSLGPRGATTEALADLAKLAVACLHARGAVMASPAKKSPFRELKRFGIAGFSFGGKAMWAALRSAVDAAKQGRVANTVREIYAFDANEWSKQQSDPTLILTTAAQTGDLRLRVSAAHKQGATMDSFPASAKLMRSAHPDASTFPDVYDLRGMPAKAPTNRWFLHYVSVEFARSRRRWFEPNSKSGGIPDDGSIDRGTRHQFAVFGGEDADKGDTFLRRFIDDSGF